MEENKKKVKNNFFKIGINKIKSLDKKKKIIFSIVGIVLLLILIIGIIFLITRTKIGNTSGNINNKGWALKSGSNVYFFYENTNLDENVDKKMNGIYKISNSGKIDEIQKEKNIRSINKVGKWIYYETINEDDYSRQIIKIDKNGKNKTVLVDEIESESTAGGVINVVNNWIYYTDSENKLERIKTNGKNKTLINNNIILGNDTKFQVVDEYIYFINKDDEFGRVNIDGSDSSIFDDVNLNSFQIVDDVIYYIDNNRHICKMDLECKNQEVIIEEEVDFYNVDNGYIYYYINSVDENNERESAIYKYNIKNKEKTKIVDLEASYTYISVVGDWIYYLDKIENDIYYVTTYRIKTDGSQKEAINVNK